MSLRDEIKDLPVNHHPVEALCKMARLLGYRDPLHQLINRDGTVVGDLLYFFEDNPGAAEALVQWVLEEGRTSDGEELDDEGDDQDSEEEDEEGDE